MGASALGLCLFAACSEDSGLLDLTLNADPQTPPPQAATVELVGSGGILRSYAGKFPPDGANSLRLEYPNLPARTITFSVQTLDSRGCVVGESTAPFQVEVKAGTKVTAATNVRRSSKACGDGGGIGGVDANTELDAGQTGVDARTTNLDAAFDTPTVSDVAALDLPAMDLPGVDSSAASDVGDGREDAPLPANPTIISFTASPPTISAGSSTALTAIFKNATGSSVDHGIGSVTSGNGVGTGPLTATTTYKLTVTDAGGNTASQTVTVTVVPLPSITSFTALMPTIATGTLTQLTGVFTGGTGSVDNNIGAVTSGAAAPTDALFDDTFFTLTVTNAAGDVVARQILVGVSRAVGAGTVAPTGSMMVSRASHTATLLPNGKVLIAGGTSARIAELYDPTLGTFSETAGLMTTARDGHTATLLRNGKILLAGGEVGTSANQPSTGEIYDPLTETFKLAGAETDHRFDFAAASLPNGGVLLVGGDYGSTATSTAEVFDAVAGAFTATGAMKAGRQNTTATLLSTGQVLVAGGYYLSRVASSYLSTAELYDPQTGLFTLTAGPIIEGRAAHTATLLHYSKNDYAKVLVVGGAGKSGTLTSTELYDPMTGWFQASGPTTEPRYWHTATLLPNTSVLVAGGETSSAEIYDANKGQFGPAASMTTARSRHTATLLPNGMVLIAGGTPGGASAALSSAELYW
jgi:hypothetical protein